MAEQLLPSGKTDDAAEIATVAAVRATWTQTRTILGVILLVLVVAAVLWMLYQLEGVILLVVLAVFFAYLIAPLVDLVHKLIAGKGRAFASRAPAIGLVYLLLFGSIGGTGYLLAPQLAAQITLLGQQAPTYVSTAREHLQGWRYFVNPDHFPEAIRSAAEKTLAQSTEA